MTTENLRSRRVGVDPVLTGLSIGMAADYGSDYIGDSLFPTISTDFDELTFKVYGNEAYRMIDDGVADHARPEAITIALDKATVSIDGHALETALSDREAKVAAGGPFRYDLAADSLAAVTSNMLLRREFLQAAAATNSTLYPAGNVVNAATGNKEWDRQTTSGTNDTDPVDILLPHINRTIPRLIGRRPNTLWMGGVVWAAMMANTKIKARLFGTTGPIGSVTTQALGSLLQIPNVLVGNAVTINEAGTVADVWGEYAGLTYVAPSAGTMLPSFGYTFEQRVFDGGSTAVRRIRDEQMGPSGGWWIKRSAYYTVSLTYNAAGTLFYNLLV